MQDRTGDQIFLGQVRSELGLKFASNAGKPKTYGELAGSLIYTILQTVSQPNTDKGQGALEAYFLTTEEAAKKVESETLEIPIVTADSQTFQ